MKPICLLSPPEAEALLLGHRLPLCHLRKHRHLTIDEARKKLNSGGATWVGPKHLYETELNRNILCIALDKKTIQILSVSEALRLCNEGHAHWLKANIIELIRNVRTSPALSLRIGAALAEALARGEMFAQVATQEIVNHQPVK